MSEPEEFPQSAPVHFGYPAVCGEAAPGDPWTGNPDNATCPSCVGLYSEEAGIPVRDLTS